MFCQNCGKTAAGNYCKYCGAKLEIDSVQENVETESFEEQKARLMKNRIPHCPKCLSTHLAALHNSEPSFLFSTRFVCFWCGYEWQPYKENYPNAGKKH